MAMSRPRRELPIDVAEVILVQSRAKDLARYKAVCRSWFDLISSQRFINKHLLLLSQLSRKKKIIAATKIPHKSSGCSEVVSLSPNGDEPPQVYAPLPMRGNAGSPCLTIVGSCNGILCLLSKPDCKHVYLWNPSTREHRRAPYIPEKDKVYVFAIGFGYDASTGDYKVVKISVKTFYPTCETRGENCFVEVWTMSSTHGWRKLNSPVLSKLLMKVPAGYQIRHQSGVFLKGKLYWVVYRGCVDQDAFLISFDMGDETFRTIEILPDTVAAEVRDGRALVDFMGSLALSLWPERNRGSNVFSIWVLDEDNRTWINQFTIGPFRVGWACPAGVCIDGKFLMRAEKKYFLYDPLNEEEKELSGAEALSCYIYGIGHPCWSFVESLVSVRLEP